MSWTGVYGRPRFGPESKGELSNMAKKKTKKAKKAGRKGKRAKKA